MAQVVANYPLTLENSTNMSRPHLNTFMRPDTNVGETDITEYVNKKRHQELHIPNVTGSPDYTITCDGNYLSDSTSPQFSKKRTDLRVMDPITSFVSVGGEVLLKNQRYGLPSFGKARIEPQTTRPQTNSSIRTKSEAIAEIRYMSQRTGFIIL
jgi:hypothetical protein